MSIGMGHEWHTVLMHSYLWSQVVAQRTAEREHQYLAYVEADGPLPVMQNDGSVITVRAYLRQHFNFRYDLLGVAVAVLCAYIAILG